MAALRHLTCVRAAARASNSLSAAGSTSTRALFSTTPRVAGGHGPSYDQPTGWLWGVRPGEKYQKEGWEDIFFYGFYGSLAVFTVAYAFKPDTSIQTWALEEARRRLEAEGILEDPSPVVEKK